MLIGTDGAKGTATSSVAKSRVLLVHGIADSAASMRVLQKRLARDGRESLAISLTPGDGSVSLETLALQLRDYVRDHFSPSERFDLLGFSMGGLICRYYVQLLGGYRRVDRLIIISSPNHGTLLAFLNSRVGCKEAPRSAFCKSLITIARRCAIYMCSRFGRRWIWSFCQPRARACRLGSIEKSQC